MGSNSGLRDGEFDRLNIAVDLAVGDERNFGTDGQVLTSGGEGEELFWGTNSATLPQGLVAGSNITFNPAGTYNGSVETTIASTDTNTEYQGGTGISIDTTTSPKDTINCSNIPNSALANSTISGKALGTNLDNLTAGTGLSFSSGTEYNGSAPRELVCDITQGITNVIASDGIITTTNGTEKTIKTHIDLDTLDYKTGSPTKIIEVKKVPNSLTAGTNITFTETATPTNTETTFDGSKALTITATDTNTEYTGTAPVIVNNTTDDISLNLDDNAVNGTFLVNASGQLSVIRVPSTLSVEFGVEFTSTTGGNFYDGEFQRVIRAKVDGTTIANTNASNSQALNVLKVPNKLKPGSGITMSGDYDGSAEITISSTDATTTETIVVQVFPTTDTSYAVYRRQLTDPRSLTEQFYIIDTNFKYQFTSPPEARYYKVDIQFVLSNSAINLPALAIEPVFLRLDKDDDGDNAWGIPQLVDIAYATGGTLQIKQASFILDFGTSFATLSVPEYPQIFPSMIQQSSGAVSPSAGRRATNENAIVVYGGAFFPQGLKMVLTPMGTDITTTTTGNPFSITGSDGISFVSNNIVQNPYISIATRVQEATKIFSAGTSYTEYSSDFRVSFIATSSNIIVEFRAIVRADNKLFYGGLYDYNASTYHTNTRTRFNYNDESDQDFTTITWIMKGLTKGNTYYISPYFRGNSSSVYIYAGHNNTTDGYAPAIMRIFDGGNDVSYVEPADDY